MRVCDYIAKFIYEQGVSHVFTVVGGGMMYLADGLASQHGLKVVCTHHEQAAAMAAVSYAKYTGNIGVVYVTTGCGGTNALTGLLHAWQDNVPCIFISGQSNREDTIRGSGLKLRQVGVQEADIISIVESITKSAVMINKAEEIRFYLEQAVFLSKVQRKGPVWIDVPLDIQNAEVDHQKMLSFGKEDLYNAYNHYPEKKDIEYVRDVLSKSQRPIIVAGQGIRLSDSIDSFRTFIEKYNIPYVASRLGIDLLSSEHPLFIGRIGTKGDRAGNFALQNADVIISIGSRLSISSTGYDFSLFAREAKVIAVDIDAEEHKKRGVRIDYFIHSDIKHFIEKVTDLNVNTKEWVVKCSQWKKKWPVCLDEYFIENGRGVNTYVFVNTLSKHLKEDSVVVSDAGGAFFVTSQALMLKEGQRYITSGGQAEMGYTLPACVGISVARWNNEVIGITGDGSFQMNIQELQTLKHYNLPVKLFVWNNNGYASIRETQTKFFEGRFIGTHKEYGVSFPDIHKIADAYELQYFKIDSYLTMDYMLDAILRYNGPAVCEVVCRTDQKVAPVLASGHPLEDMYPFLDRKEFYENMIVKPINNE